MVSGEKVSRTQWDIRHYGDLPEDDIDNHTRRMYNYETKRKRRIDHENKGIYRRK